MTKHDYWFLFFSYFLWLSLLFAVLFYSTHFLPIQKILLGGGSDNYFSNPLFWAWSNFDGQHYTNIAQNGYGYGEYTFFPLYPLLIKLVTLPFELSLSNITFSGVFISNVCFIISLVGFYKLARLDFSMNISRLAVVVLLLFPTSFYFGAVYTESLFFALLVWAFYFYRRKKYLHASVLGILLTVSRPVGVFIFFAFAVELLLKNGLKLKKAKKLPFSLLLIPTGLLGYMYFLKTKVNDPFAFFRQQVYVGEHRSSHIIFIPQIIYRYIFKIFPSLPIKYFPATFFTTLEFVFGVAYFFIVFALFFTTRISYAVFAFFAYITPTFLGSFSSLPRYVLVIFPVYLILAQHLSKSKLYLFVFCSLSFILLIISFSLFVRGYWIS